MATTKREHKLRMLALREQILALIEEHGQLHSHQLARMIGVKPISVASCCVSLEKKGWLAYGDLIKSNDGFGDTLQGWVRGSNHDPLPHPDEGKNRRVAKPLERPMLSKVAPVKTGSEICGVTDEDLQWMVYYRKRYELRQARQIPECVIHQALTNAA